MLHQVFPIVVDMAVVVKTNGIPFWGRCTTHFRTYFSGDWDVHWGYGLLTHGHMIPEHHECLEEGAGQRPQVTDVSYTRA